MRLIDKINVTETISVPYPDAPLQDSDTLLVVGKDQSLAKAAGLG